MHGGFGRPNFNSAITDTHSAVLIFDIIKVGDFICFGEIILTATSNQIMFLHNKKLLIERNNVMKNYRYMKI